MSNAPPGDTRYYYLLVRRDIPLADQLVQVAHVALTAGATFPLPAYHHLVFLEAKHEAHLVTFSETLTQAQVPFVLFHEPDNNVGYTALCSGPLEADSAHRTLFRRLRLWRPPTYLNLVERLP